MLYISMHDCRWSRLFTVISIAISYLPHTNAATGTNAADFYVHSLPGAPNGPLLKMHAGHIEVTPETHGNLFFWHYQNKHIGDRPRTVIWLNGGPGCSSEDGALMEIGPYRVNPGGKLTYNNGSWDEFANVLFVDNPVGTGYSYVNSNAYIHDLAPMADQFVTFLEKWFTIFPQYEHDDLYLAGESYAGQHIPYIADAILNRNKNAPNYQWNLKGLLIGNGWTSPEDQYPAYLKFSYANGLVQHGSDLATRLEVQQQRCMQDLAEGGKNHPDTTSCEAILQEILKGTADTRAPENEQCYNMYDIRLMDSYPSCGMNWPPDLRDVTPYLQREDVMSALHVVPHMQSGWAECNGAVGGAFNARKSAPAIQLLPHILETVPIILFSGDQDLICNHYGTENLIHNMQWNGGKGFELSPNTWAPRREWTFESQPAGQYQEARNLTYIKFYNASHMVPFDYPRRTRDMLDRFMGVDIASIGGSPADSRIDGEKGLETSVGGHPNSTVAEQDEKGKLKAAEWQAYKKSGEVILVLLIFAAGGWGFWVWRERRRRAGYRGVAAAGNMRAARVLSGAREALGSVPGLERFRQERGDLEAADFDESELDDLEGGVTNGNGNGHSKGEKRYDSGSESDDEHGHGHAR